MLVRLARGRARSKYTLFAKKTTNERDFEPPNPCPPGTDSSSTVLLCTLLMTLLGHTTYASKTCIYRSFSLLYRNNPIQLLYTYLSFYLLLFLNIAYTA